MMSKRLVLFYAQSGAGKSSLINTRLIPALEEENFYVLPIGRVGGEPLSVDDDEVDNIFVLNLLLSIDENQNDIYTLASTPLVDYFKQSKFIPPPDDSLQDSVHVLIIDQFEEILTTHPDRWRHREDFFRQLRTTMAAYDKLWVVLSLREDYVASLERYEWLLPGRLRSRLHMHRMDQKSGLLAITGPAEKHGRPFAPNVAEILVDSLRRVRIAQANGSSDYVKGQFIEPVQLQVVCHKLWEQLDHTDSQGEITEADLKKLANNESLAEFVDSALAQFYEDTLKAVTHDEPNLSESELRDWFERELIIGNTIRNLVLRGETKTGHLPNHIVDKLQNAFLLRTEERANQQWYELGHDRFIEPIIRSNDQWRDKYPILKAAQEWRNEGKPATKLYKGPQLVEALKQFDHLDTHLEKQFLQASQAAEEEQTRQLRANKRLRWAIVTITIMLVIAVGIAIVAWYQWDQANTQWQRAERAENIAQSIRLANIALTQLNSNQGDNNQLALLLSKEAVDKFPTNNAIAVLLTALKRDGYGGPTHSFAAHTNWVNSVAFSPDSQTLASGGADTNIILWDLSSSDPISTTLLGHTDGVKSVAFSPDGQTLASGSADSNIILWDLSSSDPISTTLPGHTDWVNSVAFSPDGQTLASGGADNTIFLWDLSATVPTGTVLTNTAGTVTSLAFSPDGQFLAAGNETRNILLWDLKSSPDVPYTITGHSGAVNSVTFSPDSHRLASASGDKTIRIWDVSNRQQIGSPFSSHKDGIFALAFSPDGNTLVSGSGDSQILMWDTASHQPIGVYTANNAVNTVAFSPDGQTIVSGDISGTVRIWEVSLTTWLEEACRHAGRNLTWSEWAQYFFEVGPYRKTCPQLNLGPSFFNEAKERAKDGDIAGAQNQYKRALELEPTLDIVPNTEIARALLERARETSLSGDLLGAQKLLQQAKDIAPDLQLNFEDFIIVNYSDQIEQGKQLAEAGDIEGAKNHFQQGLQLVDTLLESKNDELERQKILQTKLEIIQNITVSLIELSATLAQQGQIDGAIEISKEVVILNPSLRKTAIYWNDLCHLGIYGGNPKDLVEACNQAVALAPDDGWIRHDRAIILALTEVRQNYDTAASDLAHFIAWSKSNGLYDQYGPVREEWLNRLNLGSNPIDDAALELLRSE
ncbi:MAG: hypothetical protein KDJ52_10845 [Anaerolineae bacterium]|nr:hypothetical protein [Anaerolineae bacterium]